MPSDGIDDSNIATFSITIATNLPPEAFDQADHTKIDVPLAVGLDANDAEFDALTFIIDSGPTHGSLDDCSSGSCTYTPEAGYSGPDSFTWKANDGPADSNVATFSITVEDVVNTPPTAVDDEYTVRRGEPDRSSTSRRTTRTRSSTRCRSPQLQNPSAQGGSVDCSSGSSCTYAPALGFTGTDTFTYTIDDGNGHTDTATVTVTVEPCPDLDRLPSATRGIVTGQQWIACSSHDRPRRPRLEPDAALHADRADARPDDLG